MDGVTGVMEVMAEVGDTEEEGTEGVMAEAKVTAVGMATEMLAMGATGRDSRGTAIRNTAIIGLRCRTGILECSSNT